MNPIDQLRAEQATSRQAALNILLQLKAKELIRQQREQAIRAQYIHPHEITG